MLRMGHGHGGRISEVATVAGDRRSSTAGTSGTGKCWTDWSPVIGLYAARLLPQPIFPTGHRAPSRTVLKDEPDTLVERLVVPTANGDGDTVVVKTYRVRGLRWLQSWWRQSRAQREHDHLATIVHAGVPCLEPLGWSAEKRTPFGFRSSTLRTRFLADSVPLKQVLRSLARDGADGRARARLATAMGALVADLHAAGVLWCTPMPRNVLVVGDPAAARLAVCDTPACIRAGKPLTGSRLCRIDLFKAGAMSPEIWRGRYRHG